MQWKYSFPDPWTDPSARVALEDVFLIPPDGRTGPSSYWFTLEGLHSFTGGTHDEKLERLGNAEFVISDSMDMLIRREDFNRSELLEWTRLFIRHQLSDPEPVLVEASPEESAHRLDENRRAHNSSSHAGQLKLMFVHPRGAAQYPFPESILEGDPRVAIRTASLGDDALGPDEQAMVAWADVLMVMEKRMRHVLRRRLKEIDKSKRVVCLHLPEFHDVHDPAYVQLIRERINVYLEKFGLGTGP
jgi:predicted protein tyrosine phosphatase